MPRPRSDGRPPRVPLKRKLTELGVRVLKPGAEAYLIWDTLQHGLAIRVQPTGSKSWKVIYSRVGRARWLHLGDANAIGLANARTLAAEAMLEVARGGDPAAAKKAERGSGTFAELADRYVELHSKKNNKSWKQADGLIRRYAVPRWGKMMATAINRTDVKALLAKIEAPVLANQVLASASAIFSWAIKEEILPSNPCKLVDRNATRSRERVLSDSEVPKFWNAFDDAGLVASCALKMILLTGQRPGEVLHMRREHIVDGWWQMPGAPEPKLGWPGTKNAATHRVWLPKAAQAIIAELGDGPTGFVFAGPRGRPVDKLDEVMREICKKLGVGEKVTPHDLRRTFSTRVVGLDFGRPAMHRLTNHKPKDEVGDVYDRHSYAEQNKKVWEAVAAHIVALVEDRPAANVVSLLHRGV